MVIKFVSVLLAVLLCTGCMTDSEAERRDKINSRVHKETKEGVHYFLTCAEGFLFLSTGRGLAGPIGVCEEE